MGRQPHCAYLFKPIIRECGLNVPKLLCVWDAQAMSVYSVISLGNFLTSEGSLVQGGLLVFGNAALAEYSVGSGLDAPAASYDLSRCRYVLTLPPCR